MKKVLIIEDDETVSGFFRDVLYSTPEIEIVTAVSLDEAREKFAAHNDFAAIVVDGCLKRPDEDRNTLDTLELTSEFRKTFNGPMIASSSVPEFRVKLVAAGCDVDCPQKTDVPKVLKVLLNV